MSKGLDRLMSERLLAVADVAELLQCGSRKARETMLKLPHVRVGKLLRIRRDVLDRWIVAGGDEYTRPALPSVGSGGLLRIPVRKRAVQGP